MAFNLTLLLPLCIFLHLSIILSPTHLSLFFSSQPLLLPIPSASLPPSLPLSHFPPLIHLSDFTGTQGDPGQTSCRGNRQSRMVFFLRESDSARRKREKRLKGIWAPTDMYLTDRPRRRGLVSGWCSVSTAVCIHVFMCLCVCLSLNMAESEL